MTDINRRDLMKSSAALWVTSQLHGLAISDPTKAPAPDWIRHNRTLIAEGYTPPFYPMFEYDAKRTIAIASALQCDSLRYPVASYCAYFPTQSGYPIHPQMNGDPMRDSLHLLRERGMRAIAYLPLNHPFMSTESKDPRYSNWVKRFADGKPMVTSHLGFGSFYEGCLNSPVRDLYKRMVQEVLTSYDFDVIYFDGPYQGLDHLGDYCYCEHCQQAFRQRFGRPVPAQASMTREEAIQYRDWLTDDVAAGYFREICELIRARKNIPIMFNNTALLTSTGQWRDHCLSVADGFMFEAADTPEQKLFNLQLGMSTGKVIWTYIGSYGGYSRDHIDDKHIRGWFSYPFEGQEIAMDCAIATVAGAGCKYWGLSRFFYQPESELSYPEGQYLKSSFDFQVEHERLLQPLRHRAQAGVLVSDQTIKWYRGEHFVPGAYSNYFHGAYSLLKALSIEPEPFLDWMMSPEVLSRYSAVYVPNAVCLSESQCEMLRKYVEGGGYLIATHLTSAADEFGRLRSDFALADLFGASFVDATPYEYPDLYLKPSQGPLVPQDLQIVRLRATSGDVLAHTFSRGQRMDLGPAITARKFGKGQVLYIGSGLEAVFYETLMKPLLDYVGTLLRPAMEAWQTYQLDYVPGLLPHYMTDDHNLLLHIVADTRDKKTSYSPVENVRARIRVPHSPAKITLLRSGVEVPFVDDNGWIEVTIPKVEIHEAIWIHLTS